MSNDSVRRIMAEVREFTKLNKSATRLFHAAPLESDLFEWHFTVRGPPDTAFEEGVYHGRIVLPAEYPLKPPEIILLTPNGRFEVGKRICLSVTAHHQETWQPSWGIRTILTALVGFMPSKAEGVGALDYPDSDRRRLARMSWSFCCNRCGVRPIEQLYVPAAVEAGFPGAFVPPGVASATTTTGSSSSNTTNTSPTSANANSSVNEQLDEKTIVSNDEKHQQHQQQQHQHQEEQQQNNQPTAPKSPLDETEQQPNIERQQQQSVTQLAPSERGGDSSQQASSSTDSNASHPSVIAPSSETHTERHPAMEQPDETQQLAARDDSAARLVSSGNVKEQELFYLACAIVVTILAIVFRRVYVILTTFY